MNIQEEEKSWTTSEQRNINISHKLEQSIPEIIFIFGRGASTHAHDARTANARRNHNNTMKEIDTTEGDQKKREDKRTHSQLRPIDSEQGLLNRADGSAKYSQG